MGTFTSYVGAEKSKKLCDKASGGGNESSGGPKPQDMATVDGKSDKGTVMLAVRPEIFKKYQGCKVEIPGYGNNFEIQDSCPGCGKGHMDVSFKNSKEGCAGAEAFGKQQIGGSRILCNGGDRSEEFASHNPVRKQRKKRR